ncbi:MAG TPA: hypothetical protein VF092_21570 [Longimicrobium sp.]
MGLLRLVICCVTVALWAVIGLFFWVALIARTAAVFSVIAIYAAVTGADVSSFSRQFEGVAGFYPLGFSRIIAAVYPPNTHAEERPLFERSALLKFGFESVWAIVFWGSLAFFPVRAWLQHEAEYRAFMARPMPADSFTNALAATIDSSAEALEESSIPDSIKFETLSGRAVLQSIRGPRDEFIIANLIECTGRVTGVTCLLNITTERDIDIRINGGAATVAYDNFGDRHVSESVKVRGVGGESLDRRLVVDTPIPLRIEFPTVPVEATHLQLVTLRVSVLPYGSNEFNFRAVPITRQK